MLNINEIFCSFDGEVNAFGQGRRTVFVRLQGCNLSPPCSYCDTNGSIEDKHVLGFENKHILEIVKEHKCDKVTITGGEPLLQYDAVRDLVCDLKKHGMKISVETNGSIEVDAHLFCIVDSWIVDYKIGLAGYKFQFPIKYMNRNDWIKFPIQSVIDFKISLNVLSDLRSANMTPKDFNVAWSPIYPKMTNEKLMDLMHEYKVDGNLNIQIHKLLGVK